MTGKVGAFDLGVVCAASYLNNQLTLFGFIPLKMQCGFAIGDCVAVRRLSGPLCEFERDTDVNSQPSESFSRFGFRIIPYRPGSYWRGRSTFPDEAHLGRPCI